MARFNFDWYQLPIYHPNKIDFGTITALTLTPETSFLSYFIV